MKPAWWNCRSAPTRFLINHPAAVVFLVAFAIRLASAITIAVSSNGTIFPDDDGYMRMATAFATGKTGNWELTETWGLWNINASFLFPTGVLFYLFGFHPILGQMLSVLAGTLTATAVAVLVRRHASATAALFAGLAVAVFPSQILWSSLLLKDSFSWMALSLMALALGGWGKTTIKKDFVSGFLLIACLSFFLAHLRVHTLTTVLIAAIITLIITAKSQRSAKVFLTLLLLAVLPLSVNAGLFSHNTFASSSNLGSIRSNMARNARTAINGPRAIEAFMESTSDNGAPIDAFMGSTSDNGAPIDAFMESTSDNGAPIEAFMESTSDNSAPANSAPANILYIPVGLRVMLLDPLPNHLARSPNMKYAFAEHLLWYPLLLLALVGVVSRLKHPTPEFIFTLLVTGGLATMWALVEGNFGTAYRHRGELVWGVAVLAGIGLDHLLNSRKSVALTQQQASLTQDS